MSWNGLSFALHIMLGASPIFAVTGSPGASLFTQLHNVAKALTIPDDIMCKKLLSFLTGN
jgi:hypothetical protein